MHAAWSGGGSWSHRRVTARRSQGKTEEAHTLLRAAADGAVVSLGKNNRKTLGEATRPPRGLGGVVAWPRLPETFILAGTQAHS